MIPLRDILPTRRFPVVNWVIIATNVAAFILQLGVRGSVGDQAYEDFIRTWGFVPATLTTSGGLAPFVPIVTSMFMHGGWMHIIMNLWFLYIFGDNVEDALGRVRYPIFYLFCGVGAAVAQYAIDPASTVPMVGASGAIAGVIGAYLVFYPRARVVTLLPIFVFLQIIELPAFLYILLFFVADNLLRGIGSLASHAQGGVAFWAHLGGFAAGMILGPLTRRRDQPLLDPKDYVRPPRRYGYRDSRHPW